MARVRLPGRPAAARVQANDTREPWLVAPVLATLLVYCWCYTNLAGWVGVATPAEVVGWLGASLPEVVDADGNVAAKLAVTFTGRMDGDDERLIVFAALFGGWVSAYFLSPRWRSAAAVAWFVPAFAWLYGGEAAA